LVETVRYGPSDAAGTYPGEVRARHEAELAFRIDGKITARPVDVGATVHKGQLLARLDPKDVLLSAQAARAQLSAAETDYRFAAAELKRARSLLEQRFISQTAFDAKRNAYKVAEAAVTQARAQRTVAGNQAGYADLVANDDGVITAVTAEVGQVVAAGQPVMRLAQPAQKEVWISVPESRVAELRETNDMTAYLWAAPAKSYTAKVREMSPSADPVMRTFQVKLALPDADDVVQLGMTANVLLRHDGGTPVAKVPLSALGSLDAKPVLWIIDGKGQVQPRVVDVKEYRQDGAIIRSGVKNGDRIVVVGVHKLAAGLKVEARAAPTPVNPSR
jgi:multidrug efflux system membrane fusion protein